MGSTPLRWSDPFHAGAMWRESQGAGLASGHGVAFTERNEMGNLDPARALLATGTFATPLVVIGPESVFGFRSDRVITALADKR